MANLIMTNWYIEDKTPYFNLGSAGENNAKTISIQIDDNEVIANAHYYLDIGDESGLWLPNTQELQFTTSTTTKTVTKTITVIVTDEETGEEVEQEQEIEVQEEETINILYLKPLISFLGRDGVKLLQIRCEYIDENQEEVTKESNVIHAVVDKNSGFIYKYDI